MQQVVQGIILHSIRYSDSRFIVRIFCKTHGLKPFMVSAGSKNGSGVLQILQPMNVVEFESSIRENQQIQTMRNIRIAHPLHQIYVDPVKSAMVMFLNEVLYKTMADDYVNDRFFQFLKNAVLLLDDSIDPRNFHLWCLLEICRHYGFYPQTDPDGATEYFDLSQSIFCRHTPTHPFFIEKEDALHLYRILELEWPQMQDMQLHGTLRKNLLNALVRYVQLHLENQREIKSLEILHEVFH
ncbi:MAG: DNA repair protein RecO [Flavobacteriales bacterium]|nr:DNA repair protein RecO [Flavobacteriales bacterium]